MLMCPSTCSNRNLYVQVQNKYILEVTITKVKTLYLQSMSQSVYTWFVVL